MKFTILSLITVFLCLTSAKAQLTTFDLSKYKTADYTRRMLTFSGNISGSYNESEKDQDSHDQSKFFSSNLFFDYSLLKNTRKTQRETHISLSLKPTDPVSSSDWKKLSPNISNASIVNSRSNATFNYSTANRFYFRKNMFFEVNPTGYIDASYRNYETENTSNNITSRFTEDERMFNSNISVPVRFGVGRLENVEDARMAIFILEDLQKNNQLTKSISDENILAFATKITQLRNKRHFDSRKRRIYEIQALDSFIRDNGFSGSQNAVYFSGLIDNWGYANNPWRVSGNRFSIGMGPSVGYSIENHLSNEKIISFDKGLGISFLGDFERPINLKWQRSIHIEAGYKIEDQNKTLEDNNSTKTKENSNNDWAYVSFNWGYGFYPDSRSYHVLSLNPNAQKVWIKPENGTNYETKGYAYNIALWLNGYIYLSERFNINYSLSLRYGESSSKFITQTIKNNNFDTSFNLSCSYSIF